MNKKLDKSNLRKILLEYPNQISKGTEFAEKIKLPNKKYSELIICGMGGSALPADLLASYFENEEKFPFPIDIIRNYHLPKKASKKSLIFISSYSGNTEETLFCLNESIKIKATVVCFCAGGKIEKIAKEKKIPLIKYEINFENFQPRYATTYAFMAMHTVLKNIGLCKKINQLPKINTLAYEKKGKEIAKKIIRKTPIIYAPYQLKIIAKNWKIKINENSKTPAFWNYFPELNHNEMVGFTNPINKFIIIFLRDKNDSKQINKRIAITAKLFSEKNIENIIIDIEGNDYLEKFLTGSILGDWVSYYLALSYNQDPTPVDMVEDLKKLLEK